MSLKDIINNSAKTAFSAVDDLMIDVEVVIKSQEDYDPATGVINAGEVPMPVRGLKSKLRQKERELFKVVGEGFKLTFLISDLSLMPTVNDQVKYSGASYNVLDVQKDISESLLILIVGS